MEEEDWRPRGGGGGGGAGAGAGAGAGGGTRRRGRTVTPRRGGGGWGVHLSFFLSLLTMALVVEAVTTEPQRIKPFLEYSPYPSPPSTVAKCLGAEHVNPDIKPQHLYVNEREQALTMLTSQHVPHQLMTRIVAIFLKEWLGYVNLSIITVPESFDPWTVVEEMKPKKSNSNISKSSIEVQIPQAMVNLKVWVPPGYNLEPITTEFDTSSYLGSGGRFGWFLPASLLDSNDFILEHWRSFITKNSPALKIFHRTPEELKTLSHKVRDPVTQEFYCPGDLAEESLECSGGIFSPPWCQASNAVCAVLFTSTAEPDIAEFLHKQILTMGAFVRVAYIGPHLDHNFLKANLKLPGQPITRSILVFHWWPSVLLEPFNFTSVSFPPCIDSSQQASSSTNSFFQCKYEMHPFHKFVWRKLERYAKFAYEALHMVQISNIQFNEVLNIYNRWNPQGPDTLDKVACFWMKKNKVHWQHWHSGRILHELRLVGLFPLNSNETDRFKFVAPGSVPAYFMAVEAVNHNTSILKDYDIRSIVLNGACNSAIVMRKFIEILQLSSSQGFYNNMIGFVGPACSDTIEPIAGVSKYFNLPIISYGAEGAIFSGQDDYPYFFRTIPENKIFGYVYKHLFRSMGWRRIASLVEEGHRYSEYLTVLEELLQEHNMTLDKKEFSDERKTSDVISKLQMLNKEKYRIIIGDFYQDVASEVLCGASHLRMTGRQGYLWFLPHWFSKNWYDTDVLESNNNCSTEQMSEALEGHMSLSYKYFAEKSQVMQTGQTVSQWRDEYRNATKKYNIPESDYAGFTYDAVWVYALALDKLFKEDPSYAADLRATNTTQAFIKKISGLSFNGVSGHINFTSDSLRGVETRNSRLTDIIVWQFQKGEYVKVATYHPKPSLADEGELEIYEDTIVWPSGSQPDDGSEKCVVEGFRNFLNLTCTQAVVVLCTICFGSLTLVLLVCFFIFKRRYEKKLEQMQELWRGRPLFEIFDGWEIPRDKVVINRKLGEGAFGTVYGGECLFDSQGWVAVAVKTLKLGSTISEKLDFLSEAEMMKNFEHENIVHLLGVCTKTEPIYTVMEFMLYGDLKTYLLARRNLVNEKSRNDDDEVSNKRLTSMAVDIARGLAYLAQMKYVHRDVACRNCLVNANRTVKLADFGMTRPMYENNYYKFHRKGMLPVRWMAPESLTDGVFTTMSDIWSYGVLLYEIVTFGAFPFQGLTNDQVLEHVKAGHTIAIPRGVKPQLEMLLRLCWHRAPSRRPPVHHIIEQLTNHPRLISPCLDSPQSSVQCEDTRSLEIIPDKTRKSSLSINHRLQNMASSSSRKRSMSGNMVINVPPLTTSLSEDGMIAAAHSNLDALNLNHVMLEEGEPGEDPLLPPAQYVSSRYVSLAHKEQQLKERESLVGGPEGDYCTTDISRDLWTNVTPV